MWLGMGAAGVVSKGLSHSPTCTAAMHCQAPQPASDSNTPTSERHPPTHTAPRVLSRSIGAVVAIILNLIIPTERALVVPEPTSKNVPDMEAEPTVYYKAPDGQKISSDDSNEVRCCGLAAVADERAATGAGAPACKFPGGWGRRAAGATSARHRVPDCCLGFLLAQGVPPAKASEEA